MGEIVIEHVNVSELPETWRARLPIPVAKRVTVRIEEETEHAAAGVQTDASIDLLFGMWRDREDMADVEGYIRKLRAPRFNRDGSRSEG